MSGWKSDDIMGFMPSIDPRRSDKIFALNGDNYVFDSLGPKSAFGNRFLSPVPVGRAAHAQGFRLRLRGGDRCFSMFGDGIFEWNESIGGWDVIYITPDTTTLPYRWTHGYLNGFLYFCHPRLNTLLAYDLESRVMLPVDLPGSPIQPLAMVVDNGRVCALTSTAKQWSAPSNGLNWVPALGGPGFQNVADRVAGDPVMITSYTGGTLVWTTGGVMRGEFTGDAEVYRFRAINTEYRLVNPFCSVKIDDNTVVILDERGLFQSRGEAPSALTPLFNEFLIEYLQRYNLRMGQNVRLEWDDLQRRIYLSLSLSELSPIYERCFVLYPPLDKWGQFNESHFGILPLRIGNSERADDYYGFVGNDSVVRYWVDLGSRQNSFVGSGLNLASPKVEKPLHPVDGDEGIVFSTSVKWNTVADTEQMIPEGYFPRDGLIAEEPQLGGLAAKIQIGLLRFNGDNSATEIAETTELVIGSNVSGTPADVAEDWQIIPNGTSDEDYLAGTGAEDFGFEITNQIQSKLRIISTNDGKTEFMSQVPVLTTFHQGNQHYAISVVGVFFILEMAATDVGEGFHLRQFELTAIPAGQLT